MRLDSTNGLPICGVYDLATPLSAPEVFLNCARSPLTAVLFLQLLLPSRRLLPSKRLPRLQVPLTDIVVEVTWEMASVSTVHVVPSGGTVVVLQAIASMVKDATEIPLLLDLQPPHQFLFDNRRYLQRWPHPMGQQSLVEVVR